MSPEQLQESARAAMATEVPTESHLSLLVPSGDSVAFMFCTAVLQANVGLFLLPPSRLVYMDPVTGQKISSKIVTPADFERSDPPGQLIGRYDMLRGVKPGEDFLTLQHSLFRNYELILPYFFTEDESPTVEIRAAANDFLSIFMQIAEEPLLPYYTFLGREFFSWLKHLDRDVD